LAGQEDIAKALIIDEGADLDKQDKNGESALMVAGKNCSKEIVRFLEKAQANNKTNLQDKVVAYIKELPSAKRG
jgi:ankyrin repeat protein